MPGLVQSRMKFPASMLDLHRYQSTAHGHDFDGLSRVVMVRKTDQRTFSSAKNGEEPKFETITRETIETFHGNRTERKVTSLEKREGVRKSPELGFDSSTETIHLNGTGGAHSRTATPKKVSSLVDLKKEKQVKVTAKSPEQFANECLLAHNEYRSKHGVPLLTLSKKLCKVSQKWADKIAKKGTLEQSNDKEYGENLYCSWSSSPDYQPNGREPVDSWYEENKRHNYGTEPNDLRSGHFSQVVWKETTELGVAFSRGQNGRVFVVANYNPPGNFIGTFANNVPPPGGFPTSSTLSDTTSTIRSRPSSTGAEGDFEKDCLNAHNEYRKMHGVGPLKLNKKMCKYSEEWAKALAIKGQMEHRKNSEYGENIYCSWSSNLTSHRVNGKEPVDQWYSEIKNHLFGREPNNLKTGHFTQVIWKDSKELGVAIAKNRNGQIFVVANYTPPGNFVGSFAENVLPLGGGKQLKKEPIISFYSISNFSIDGTKIHNDYRKKHGVPELKYNEDLTNYAKEWAEKLAAEDRFYHRPDTKYGENIFYLWSSDPNAKITPKDVCKSWYEEIKDYSFASEPRQMKAGHFTQMVWRGSTAMGMAMARGRNGKIYVVANYNPRGNVIGQFSANVPRPR